MKHGYLSRTQHSVGQGGFHSACLDVGDRALRWVYDCGSTNSTALTAAIDRFAKETPTLDLLFLSHLDEDHSNGVDRLMASVAVDTVILPYLSPFLRAMLLVEAAAAPQGTRSATTAVPFLLRPVSWFLERGATRVLLVLPQRDGGEASLGNPGGPNDNRNWELARLGARLPTKDEVRAIGAKPAEPVEIVDRGGLVLSLDGRPLWELVPYAHAEPEREEALRLEVASWLRLGLRTSPADPRWLRAIKTRIADPGSRAELAKMYTRLIRSDRNLSSMALFAGPSRDYAIPTSHPYSLEDAAWMGTGDMHLDVSSRLRAFEAFYGDRLKRVKTFMLPHHGAARNIRPSFLMGGGFRWWVAAHGLKNSYGHPDKHLLAIADQFGSVVQVTERSSSEYVQSFSLHNVGRGP